ncbi:hypothetical protein ACQ4PT_002927 [Festuca glaucescens]
MSWYARLCGEKKEEYLKRQRIARQQKKAASRNCAEQGQAGSAYQETDKTLARRQRDQARRNMLTPDVIEDINSQRRASRHKLNIDERNASQRARRQILTPEERQTMLAKRNAKAVARRNTPCAESIAMKCPFIVSAKSTAYPSVIINASRTLEESASPHASPSACTRNYTTETDGDYLSRTLDDSFSCDDFLDHTEQTNDQPEDQRKESRSHRRARERAQKELMEEAERRRQIAHHRSNMQSIPHGERHAQQQRCNARFAAKHKTPAAETFTMSCPDACTSSAPNPSSSTHASPPRSPLESTQAYTVNTDGKFDTSYVDKYYIIISFTYRLKNVKGEMESFLARLMEENPNPGDLMDDEYYLFAGEGTNCPPSNVYILNAKS